MAKNFEDFKRLYFYYCRSYQFINTFQMANKLQ